MKPQDMNGGQLQSKIISTGHVFGWKFAHFRSVRTSRGGKTLWETPVGADGKGWPDLVIVHPERGEIYYREIKSRYEKVRPEQQQWGDWLLAAGCDWAIWRPTQWDEEILPLLSFGRAR